ncbi:Myosin heavy chain [Phytophthora megakarya]|uniref:Myosin heavy chain n=1 Tax=Phytophthora megakarya TaxID=4795 RepID=A0A225VZZ4_9STRA|nr:Myosin heavy chain [Phytophthora megakarya]
MRADSTSDSDSDSISCDESVVDELDDDHKSSLNALESSVVSTSTEIGEIKQSVQRLRAQRTRVEQLSQRNEELERQLDRQKAENETLQREVFTLRGAEQENVVYLQSVKLLKERSHELEDACTAKKLELRSATKKLSSVEHECDRLREEIQNSQQDHVDEVKVLRDKQKKLLQRIMQLEQSHEAQSDDQKRIEHHWKQKMKSIARSNSHLIDSLHIQLEQSLKETTKLKTEVHELETQAQNLVATTVRQTTIIEECDRVLSETKTQQQQTQCNYEEQLQLLSELSSKAQRLEAKVTSLQQSKGAETVELEREVLLLKSKLAEHQGQLKAGEEALKRKDKEIEVIQRTYVTRDKNRLSLDEVLWSALHPFGG